MEDLRHRLLIALAAVLSVAGCGDDGGARELEGLRIERELEPPPGGVFWAPIDVAASADRIWVLDAGAACVYGYDRGGAYRLTVGRKGRGPGELDQPLAIGVAGDTLWVLNSRNQRIEYYSVDGASLGSSPFPDSLPPPVDLVRWAGGWFATTPFPPGPVLWIDPATGGVRALGATLAERARELSGGGAIPNAWRLEADGDRLWALHLYLPLAGVYDERGRLLRVVTYPGPEVDAERPVEEELGEGAVRRTYRSPRAPAGALGLLHDGDDRYLLTHQRSEGRQRAYRLDGDRTGEEGWLVPQGWFLLTSVVSGGKSYVIGTRGADEEPTVFIAD